MHLLSTDVRVDQLVDSEYLNLLTALEYCFLVASIVFACHAQLLLL